MNHRRPLIVRFFEAGLKALPPIDRERYGREMLSVLEDEWVDTRGARRPFLFARILLDLAVSIVWFRIRSLRGGQGRLGSDVWMDLRMALRSAIRRPLSAIAIVLSLVLGIGLNTAVFSLVNGLLLRPLPYPDASELVQLSQTAPDIESMDVSLPDFDVWRGETTAFTGMFAFDDASFLLTNADRPEVVEGAVVSPGFLEVLGLQPALGRGFSLEEEEPGRASVVIISDALWERRFSRSPDALESTLILNGSSRRIVGVAPPNFHFPEVAHVWVPLAFDPLRADPEDYGFDVIARLGPGEDLTTARVEGDRIAALLAAESPATKARIGTSVYSLRSADVPVAVGGLVVTLLAAATLVMLIACANISSLLLARGDERRSEMAVRRALGAGRGRLIRQVFVEVGLFTLLGVCGALVVGYKAVELLPALLPGERPFWIRFDLDVRVFAWGALMGALCSTLIALPPALQAAREQRSLAGRRVLSNGATTWVVRGQVALATTLVACSGLTLTALNNLYAVDPGVDVERVLVLGAPLPPWSYQDGAARAAFYQDAMARVRAIPGVVSVSSVDVVPLLSSGDEVALNASGRDDTPVVGVLSRFSDGYFDGLGVPLIEGRHLSAAEVWSGERMAVVSESLARSLWPGESPLGKRVRHGVEGSRSPTIDDDQPWFTVSAVVGDVHQSGLGAPARGMLYVPMGQGTPGTFTLLVRTSVDPLSLAPEVRARVHEVDPTLPFYEATTMEVARDLSVWTERTISALLTGFALLAMALSILGIYGVMSNVTNRRRRELGLRRAVGATEREVVALVLRRAVRLLLPGLGVGLLLAAAASVVFRAALFGVGALAPVPLLGAVAVFLGAGVLAAFQPARRAARAHPAQVLSVD
ncbi:MAG: ADOP family duplicated permease [Gemmatimonadota bacterium]